MKLDLPFDDEKERRLVLVDGRKCLTRAKAHREHAESRGFETGKVVDTMRHVGEVADPIGQVRSHLSLVAERGTTKIGF